jgi:hypothetical protein|tara:strand:+ start:3385 stop:3552 length:168 start_codon:yes stop_codon:yes gene_type:complete
VKKKEKGRREERRAKGKEKGKREKRRAKGEKEGQKKKKEIRNTGRLWTPLFFFFP